MSERFIDNLATKAAVSVLAAGLVIGCATEGPSESGKPSANTVVSTANKPGTTISDKAQLDVYLNNAGRNQVLKTIATAYGTKLYDEKHVADGPSGSVDEHRPGTFDLYCAGPQVYVSRGYKPRQGEVCSTQSIVSGGELGRSDVSAVVGIDGKLDRNQVVAVTLNIGNTCFVGFNQRENGQWDVHYNRADEPDDGQHGLSKETMEKHHTFAAPNMAQAIHIEQQAFDCLATQS